MDDFSQYTDEQLQAIAQGPAATPTTTPEPAAGSVRDMSDDELRGVLQFHQQRRQQQEQVLAPHREQVQQEATAGSMPYAAQEGAGPFLARTAVSPVRGVATDLIYAEAKGKLDQGKADAGDLRNIALYEREKGLDQQQPEWAQYAALPVGIAGNIAPTILSGGANIAAQAYAGAAAHQGQGALNLGAVGEAAPGFVLQMGVLKAMGPLAQKLFPESVTKTLAGKVGTEALTGTAGMAVGDYAAYVAGLQEHGGPIAAALDGKFGEAAKGTVANLIFTGGMAAAHGLIDQSKARIVQVQEDAAAAIKSGIKPEVAIANAAQSESPQPAVNQDEVLRAAQAAQPGDIKTVQSPDGTQTVTYGRDPTGKIVVDIRGTPPVATEGAVEPPVPPTAESAAEPIPKPPEQSQAKPEAIIWKQPIGPDEPPVAPGMIRMYHGGLLGGKGSRDFSPDRTYAEGYAAKTEGAEVGYVDLPRNSPLLTKAYDDTGTSSPAPPVHLHAPADLSESMKPLLPRTPRQQADVLTRQVQDAEQRLLGLKATERREATNAAMGIKNNAKGAKEARLALEQVLTGTKGKPGLRRQLNDARDQAFVAEANDAVPAGPDWKEVRQGVGDLRKEMGDFFDTHAAEVAQHQKELFDALRDAGTDYTPAEIAEALRSGKDDGRPSAPGEGAQGGSPEPVRAGERPPAAGAAVPPAETAAPAGGEAKPVASKGESEVFAAAVKKAAGNSPVTEFQPGLFETKIGKSRLVAKFDPDTRVVELDFSWAEAPKSGSVWDAGRNPELIRVVRAMGKIADWVKENGAGFWYEAQTPKQDQQYAAMLGSRGFVRGEDSVWRAAAKTAPGTAAAKPADQLLDWLRAQPEPVGPNKLREQAKAFGLPEKELKGLIDAGQIRQEEHAAGGGNFVYSVAGAPPAEPPAESLKSGERLNRGRVEAKFPDLFEEADQEGVPRAEVHQAAREKLRLAQEQAKDWNQVHDWLLTYKGVKEAQQNIRREVLRGKTNKNFVEELALVKGGDEAADWLEENHPTMIRRGENAEDAVYRIIREGRQEPSEEDAYRNALAYHIARKTPIHPEDLNDANRELRLRGQRELSEEDHRRLEAEIRGEVEGDSSEAGAEADAGDFAFGANEPGPAEPANLTEQEKAVLKARQPREDGSIPSFAEIGRKHGLARQRIQQIEKAALAKQGKEQSINEEAEMAAERGLRGRLERRPKDPRARNQSEDLVGMAEEGGRQIKQELAPEQREAERQGNILLRVADLMDQGYDKSAAQAKAEGEFSGERKYAMGAAHVGELTGEPGKRPPRTPRFNLTAGSDEAELKGYALRFLDGKEYGLYRTEREANAAKQHLHAGEEYSAVEVYGDPEPRPMGMGAAHVGELTGEPPPSAEQTTKPPTPRLTALAHAETDLVREALGLAPRGKSEKVSMPEIIDAANTAVELDNDLPRRILEAREADKRPLTTLETAVLLRQEADLKQAIRGAEDQLNGPNAAFARDRIAKLKADLQRTLNVTDPAGSEAGRAFVVRRAMMDSDYSYAGLLRRFAERVGREPTESELGRLKEMAKQIADLEQQLKDLEQQKKFFPNSGETDAPDKIRVKIGRIKLGADQIFDTAEQGEKPWWARMQDRMLQVQRFNLLSGATVFGKIGAAGATRIALAPVRDAVAAALGKLPYIRQVAEKSPRWGRFSPEAEKAAITTGLLNGWEAMKERSPFGSGKSEADVLYGAGTYPRGEGMANRVLNAPGELHGSVKAFPFENELARSTVKQQRDYRQRGLDPTTESAKLRIGQQAYQDALEATMMRGPGDWLADTMNNAIARLKGKDKQGQYGFLSYTAGSFLKSQVPILRVPLNIVGEALRGTFGTITGLASVGDAFQKGIENLEPERANLIMKRLTDGTIGAAFLALGAAGVVKFGGLYVPGDRRKKEIPEGTAEVNGVQIPKQALHDPRMMLIQAGATAADQARRIAGKDKTPQGVTTGTAAALAALIHDIPFVRESETIDRAMHPGKEGDFLAGIVSSFAIPQLVSWIARQTDKEHPFSPTEEPRKRPPHGFTETIEAGVPGLRQKVPAKN